MAFEKINSMNKSTVMKGFEADSPDEIHNIKEYVGKEIRLCGFIPTKSLFGPSVLVAGVVNKEKIWFNIPQRYANEFLKFGDAEIDAIMAGSVYLVNITEFFSKKWNEYSISFDIEDRG